MSTVEVHPPLEFTEADLRSLPEKLALQVPLPVLVIIGGASNLDHGTGTDQDDQALQMVRDGIERTLIEAVRPALLQTGAVVLTGGTNAGVMRMAGELLADAASALVGVVPAKMVKGETPEATLDANHTAAVLTSGARWGSETEVLFELAEALTAGTAPGVVVLANGGAVSFEEARRFLRGGWPIVTLAGSGGAAQDLIDAAKHSERVSMWGDLKQADIEQLSPDRPTARRQMVWRLHTDELLKSAWATFASYDQKADALKRSANASRLMLTVMSSLLLVAVTATVQFAVLGWTAPDGELAPGLDNAWLRVALPVLLTIAKWTALALPVGIAVAVALGSFSGSRVKWRAVRSSAETLKREIYRYRARRVIEDHEAAAKRLAAVLHVVDDEAIRADIGLAETPPGVVRGRPANVDLDELEALNARIYVKRRLENQVMWFGRAASKRRRSEWGVVVLGALAASVAMALVNTQLAPWIALLVLVATAFTVSRERGWTRQQAAGFDRAIADVNDVWIWWLRRSPSDRMLPKSLAKLVDRTESAFERESFSWSEVMRRAAQEVDRPLLG